MKGQTEYQFITYFQSYNNVAEILMKSQKKQRKREYFKDFLRLKISGTVDYCRGESLLQFAGIHLTSLPCVFKYRS